ncbi:SGNH/GDSL hydrolase family protein [Mycobacterium sp. NPDC050551]|uniref:SGNH/GDSL hydrolase family protein n=1 Tax=Mycobacterium sp. NPDC050551 TaxID=3155407 RepID=UPI00341559B0
MSGYTRYVALGDSQTEGLWDGDDAGGLTGFADRLAIMLDSQRPGLEYANLAVRGRRIADVKDHQLPRALAMRPDLVTLCIGMNDVIRPGTAFDRALGDLEDVYLALARSGATVVTTTFPDIAQILPVGRVLAGRVRRINSVIRESSTRHGFRLVDLFGAPSMREPDTWSIDRVHGSTKGHRLFAAAAAEALGLPGSSHDWAHNGAGGTWPSWRTRLTSQALWTRNMLMPYLWWHLRGRAVGDDRDARRPELRRVQPAPA